MQIYASIYRSDYVALHNPLQFLKISFNIRLLSLSNFEHLYTFFRTTNYKDTTKRYKDTTGHYKPTTVFYFAILP